MFSTKKKSSFQFVAAYNERGFKNKAKNRAFDCKIYKCTAKTLFSLSRDF